MMAEVQQTEENIVLQNVPAGETFEKRSDEANIRAAMAEVAAERGERPRDEIKIWDGNAVPETGEHQSPHSAAGRATDYMRNMREMDVAESLKTRDGYIAALKQNSDAVWNASVSGKTEEELAAELVKGKTAPDIVNTVKDGRLARPLGDHVKPINLTDDELLENPRAAARSMAEYRSAIELAQRAIVENIDAAEAEQQAVPQIDGTQSQAAPDRTAEANQPAPRPQQQADPFAAERAAIAQSYQVAQNIQAASEAEQNLAVDIRRHDQWARETFPELNDPSGQALLELREKDPQRLAIIAENYQRNRQARANLQALQTNRVAAQSQVAERARAQNFANFDKEFNRWVGSAHPNFAKGQGRNQLTAATKDYLKHDLGLSDAEINYHYSQSGLLRTPAAQKLLANSAVLKLMNARAREVASKRALPPPSQRPGVYRPAGAAALDDVRSLERQLETASGNAALRLATRLTQARRRI